MAQVEITKYQSSPVWGSCTSLFGLDRSGYVSQIKEDREGRYATQCDSHPLKFIGSHLPFLFEVKMSSMHRLTRARKSQTKFQNPKIIPKNSWRNFTIYIHTAEM